jgi:hypothetical protein
MDGSLVVEDALVEGFEVEGFERPACLGLDPVMGHKEGAIDKVDVGLDGCEAMVQRLLEGALLLVVVVRVRGGKHGHVRRVGGEARGNGGSQTKDPKEAHGADVRARVRERVWEMGASQDGSGTPISPRASRMAWTTARMSEGKIRPMLPMRNVSAFEIFPGYRRKPFSATRA